MHIKLTTGALCSPSGNSQEPILVPVCHDGLEGRNEFPHEEYSCNFNGDPSSKIYIVFSEPLAILQTRVSFTTPKGLP